MKVQEVAAIVEPFDDQGDELALKSKELVLGLLERGASPFSRDHFTPGHITCTAVVLDPAGRRFLVVHHRRLDRWLLPGGHVEAKDSMIWETARREAIEETGVDLFSGIRPVLVGIDVHGIPARGKEPYHLHHDLIFRFQARSERLQGSEETRAVEWCSFAEFERYVLPVSIRRSALRSLANW
jgi:8-oxo-dGTP pyrophosphatase MutT (NUDIX family)